MEKVKVEPAKNMVGQVDLKKLCRVCAQPVTSIYMNLLSTTENKRPLTVQLEQLTGVLVSSKDELSTLICMQCLNRLEMCEKFRADVVRAQVTQDGYVNGAMMLNQNSEGGDKKVAKSFCKDNIEIEGIKALAPKIVLSKHSRTKTQSKPEADSFTNSNNIIPTKSSNILLSCRLCLNMFTAITYINHKCETSALLPCKKCRLSFKNKKDLIKHDEEAHKKKKGGRAKYYVCIHCNCKYESPEALEDHLLNVGRQSKHMYNCDYCSRFFSDLDMCKDHMKFEHSGKRLKLE